MAGNTGTHGGGGCFSKLAYPVSVQNGDLLSDKDVSEDGHGREHCGQGHLVVDGPQGQVVHL